MIRVLRNISQDNEINLRVGTHNGIFHCDEVIAISILNILFNEVKDIEVIRSRNLELLKNNTSMMIDIGGGMFDHHQKGGNGQRENGIQYASSGLIWRTYGIEVIELLSEGKLDKISIEKIFEIVDNDIIQNIDKEDNGQGNVVHPFQFIKEFLPNWYEEEKDYDKCFEECANLSSKILGKIIKGYVSNEVAMCEICSRLSNLETCNNGILVLPSQTIPWLETIIDYNKNESDNGIDFVVFPYPDGGYALQCVPPSMEDIFLQRISLPKDWAGETTNLANISGVDSATFCHRGRFFARAGLFSDVIKMCNLARNEYNKQIGNVMIKRKIKSE